MSKKNNVFLPSGQGGLLGSVSTAYKTKFELSPKLVIYAAIAVIILIWVLTRIDPFQVMN